MNERILLGQRDWLVKDDSLINRAVSRAHKLIKDDYPDAEYVHYSLPYHDGNSERGFWRAFKK